MTNLFSTDLYVPPYRPAEHGSWKMSMIPMGTGLGYWNSERAYIYQNAAVLSNGGSKSGTWMSMTPLEIESSEWGVRPAHGNCVIMGFGMGWTAVAMACLPAVERVTVIELDPEIPALFDQTVPAADRPEAWSKVNVVLCDARNWMPDAQVDFMFADIWPIMGQPGNLDDLRAMQANVQASALYYWGQELDLGDAARNLGWDPAGGAALSDALVDAARDTLDLPLYLPEPKGALVEGAWREWDRRMAINRPA